jgi:2-polyprenyl-3-methyl-5-hydroxy-6-metoxy-1,4-benzoquinol methylase
MQVLELGCGTGTTAIAHAPYVRHIQAIDISPRMISIAQAKADAGNVTNVTFETSTIDDVNLPDQALDAVLALSVLHLLDNKEAVIETVYRMLKPGGVFVTSTACLGDGVLRLIKLVAPIGRLFGLMPLVKVFTRKALERSFTDAGFQIDYQWRPGKGMAVFIVARKPE